MFVLNIKLTKKKLLTAAVVAVGLAIIITVGVTGMGVEGNGEKPSASGNSSMKSDEVNITLDGETEAQRKEFLSAYGYKTADGEESSADVVIPYKFDATYESYNKIQTGQGFNLKKFSGCMVKRYTYEITNYDSSDTIVYANILVSEGKIIGGDVCSAELDGFMHGFKKP